MIRAVQFTANATRTAWFESRSGRYTAKAAILANAYLMILGFVITYAHTGLHFD